MFKGGLTVETTINPNYQRLVEAIATTRQGGDPSAALVAAPVKPPPAIVARWEARTTMYPVFNLVAQGKPQPGSAFKTFTVAALEMGINP